MDKIQLDIGSVYSNGYGIIAKKVMLDTNLSIEAKAIYSYLVSFAGAGATAFPGAATILHHLQISKERFYKHRKQLIEAGYIKVEQETEKGIFRRNIYTVLSKPCPQNPTTEKPYTENKDTNSNSININNLNNNNKPYRDNPINWKNRGLSFDEYARTYDIELTATDTVKYYLEHYKQIQGKTHPKLKKDKWDKVIRNLFFYIDDKGIMQEIEDYQMLATMRQHFNTRYKDCDYNILHFISNEIRKNRFLEMINGTIAV